MLTTDKNTLNSSHWCDHKINQLKKTQPRTAQAIQNQQKAADRNQERKNRELFPWYVWPRHGTSDPLCRVRLAYQRCLPQLFAARESAVATLGSIYEKGQSNLTPEQAMAQDGAYTPPIHAATMLLFMILTPPCIATMVVVKLQSKLIPLDAVRHLLSDYSRHHCLNPVLQSGR